MKVAAKAEQYSTTREWARASSLKDLCLIYEGGAEALSVRAPDISPRGMFINTAAFFPEGTVLQVRFRLARSNHPVQTRCEVRYCLRGVGVGVEFIGIAPRDEKAIREEVLSNGRSGKGQLRPAKKPAKRKR